MNSNMLYSPNDVATIINIIIGSHGGYIETPNVVTGDVAFKVMFHVHGEELQEAMVLIRTTADCEKRTAQDAVKAVQAYMGL